MEPRSWQRVDSWWSELFGLPVSLLWTSPVTIGMHAGLDDYPGIFVAARSGALHVSLPTWVSAAQARELQDAASSLMDPGFWQTWPATAGMRVLGPATHAFTDRAPAAQDARDADVQQLVPEDLESLRSAVTHEDWEEGGFVQGGGTVHAVVDGDEVVAAALLSPFLGTSGDVGVLVHPQRRGRGLGALVGGAATRDAVRRQGLARWRARDDNAPSRALSRRLGFEDYCQQLAVRPEP